MSQHAASLRLDVFGDALPARALSRCGTLRLWHPPREGELPFELNAVAFSPDSRQVASASWDTARVWDMEDGREVAVLSGHVGKVEAVLFVSRTRIATGGTDHTVRLWDAASGTELRRWTLACDGIRRLALSPDGRTLLAGALGFAVLDLETEALVRWVQPEGSAGGTSALCFSPDGSRVVMLERTFEPWRLCVLDTATWTLQWSASGELYERFAWATFSADGSTVSCANTGPGWRSTVHTYDARTGALLEEAEERGSLPVPLPDGGLVRIADNQLVFSRGGVEERTLELLSATYAGDWQPVVSPDGRWMSFARGPASVLLLDLYTGATRPEQAHRDWLRQVAFSEDGRHLLTHAQDGTVRRWDCGSGRQVERLEVDRDGYSAIWSADRALVGELTLYREERKVRVHDTRTGIRLHSVVVPDDESDLRALSRRFVVTTQKSQQPSLRFWDVERGTQCLELPGPTGSGLLGFSHDEAWFFLQTESNAVTLVDLSRPERRIRVEARARVSAVTLSRDGRLLATGDERGEVWVWSTEGVLLGTLEGHRAIVTALGFSSDGELLASGSGDTTALIWPRSAWS
ncbi:WD40 repeat domain-containing protein [Pyxidicoccus sp. 3LG]